MRRICARSVCLAFLIMGTSQLGTAQVKIEGAWKLAEMTTTGPNGHTETNPQPDFWLFTKTHFAHVGNGPTKLLDRDATDAERLAILRALQVAVGTYELKGNIVTMHPEVQKYGVRPGTYWTWELKMDGNSLRVTAKASDQGPTSNPFKAKLVRVE